MPVSVYLESVHANRLHNRWQVLASGCAGCFTCLSIFQPHTIGRWLAHDDDPGHDTALCPRCGQPTVIGTQPGMPTPGQPLSPGESADMPVTYGLLQALQGKYVGQAPLPCWSRS